MAFLRHSFSFVYIIVSVAVALYACWQAGHSGSLLWLATATIAALPVLQIITGLDSTQSPHHKIRKPITSALLLLTIAFLLLTSTPQSPVLLLAILALGGFLLNTYWAAYR